TVFSILYIYVFKVDFASLIHKKEYFMFCCSCLLVVIGLSIYLNKYNNGKLLIKDSKLDDSKFLKLQKLKQNKEFQVFDFNTNKFNDGIIINAEKKQTKYKIATTSHLHSLIVGTTGTGKTTGFIDQNIAINAKSIDKPSMIITDPKKELYIRHTANLQNLGYTVQLIDLRNPYKSIHWNPFDILVDRITTIIDITLNKKEQEDGSVLVGSDRYESITEVKAKLREIKDEIYENAKEFVYTICPIKNKEQPIWEEGARNLILSFILAMCEDAINGLIPKEKITLFNVYHNLISYCNGDISILRKYLLNNRDRFSNVPALSKTVLITEEKTLTSYLSEVIAYLSTFADDGILNLTIKSGIDIKRIDERPTAIFIVIPDERVTRHSFVTLFICQSYKEMVYKSILNEKETKVNALKRNVYFFLDEFGNLPKLNQIENMVTVGRSRRLRFVFVLQSFSQLDLKYGKNIGEIIRSNCNVKVFIGTDDKTTRNEFSELCGNEKINSESMSFSEKTSNLQTTISVQQKPLISPAMLERINGKTKGEAVISIRGYEPIYAHFTPSYKITNLLLGKEKYIEEKRKTEVFDRKEQLIDIASIKNDDDSSFNLTNEEESIEYEKYSKEKQEQEIEKRINKAKEMITSIKTYLSEDEYINMLTLNIKDMYTEMYRISVFKESKMHRKIIRLIADKLYELAQLEKEGEIK
ncbi:MAG: type IV secretory system conjugative DNA transfer family protein, partial [Clostridia bacterium]|nr:type IV secretory system conjugative DNA transfer family protein [Clostridia bacterium]